MHLKLSAIGVFVAATLCAGASHANVAYTATQLRGAADGQDTWVRGINDLGQAVGTLGIDSNARAVIWNGNGTVATTLPALAGYAASAGAINNAGQVVGDSRKYGMGGYEYGYRATMWNNGVASDLSRGSSEESGSLAINNAGASVGYSNSGGWRATRWDGAGQTVLGTLGGDGSSFAYGINDAGMVVGRSTNTSGAARATAWSGDAVIDLGTLGGSDSFAHGINNAGMVVGASMNASGDYRPTLWNGATITELGTLAGSSGGVSHKINDAGWAVGDSFASDGGRNRATLWKDGLAIDLNDYLDAALVAEGWVLTNAWDINNNGSIVAEASLIRGGRTRGFVLSISAVPEPETYAMLLAGLGLVGFAARRRRA